LPRRNWEYDAIAPGVRRDPQSFLSEGNVTHLQRHPWVPAR
jgi:hypothetical protein